MAMPMPPIESLATVAKWLGAEAFKRMDAGWATLTVAAKETVAFLWPMIVRQQIIFGAMWTAVGLILLIIGLVSGIKLNRYCNQNPGDDGAPIGFVPVVFAVLGGGALFFTWLPHLLLPEWYGIQFAIKLATGGSVQ